MNPSDNPGSAAMTETVDRPQESGGPSTMIRFIFFFGLVLIGAAIFVRWKGHRAATSRIEAPQNVAVQSVPASTPSGSSSSASAPSPSPTSSTSKQLAYDPALSSNEIAAIYAKVTTTIDEERASRRR